MCKTLNKFSVKCYEPIGYGNIILFIICIVIKFAKSEKKEIMNIPYFIILNISIKFVENYKQL